MYVTYVLYSKKFDRLYVGQTSSLIERFKSHNSLSKKGFTVRYRPWRVILVDFVSTYFRNLYLLDLCKTLGGYD
ncbi:MAG: GIY-YIG nuclease family protein [Luteibaculaceae bacterium]